MCDSFRARFYHGKSSRAHCGEILQKSREKEGLYLHTRKDKTTSVIREEKHWCLMSQSYLSAPFLQYAVLENILEAQIFLLQKK